MPENGLTVYGYENTNASSYAELHALPFVSLGKKPVAYYYASIYGSYTYDGTEKTPTVTVSGLTQDTDYTVSYRNNINAGTATAVITGIGDYTGTNEVTFIINPASVYDLVLTLDGYSYVYTGEEIRPKIYVGTAEDPDMLVEGVDYSVSYWYNVSAGTADVRIYGKGNYKDWLKVSFTITQKSIADVGLTLSQTEYTYTSSAICPEIVCDSLTEGTDYEYSYSSNTNVGTGSVTLNFTIAQKDISGMDISLTKTEYTYTASAIKPTISAPGLTSGTDYRVAYSSNTDAGTGTVTVTGIGNYTGSLELTFTIAGEDIEDADIYLTETEFIYTGSAIEPAIDAPGLTMGTDYSVSYSNNINAGMGEVTVTGLNNYSGTVVPEFTIEPKEIADMAFSLSGTEFAYTGSAIEPEVVAPGLTEGVDYTCAYYGNTEPGTGQVTITGKGNYTGSRILTFEIVYGIEAPTLSAATVVSSGNIKLSWNAMEPSATRFTAGLSVARTAPPC